MWLNEQMWMCLPSCVSGEKQETCDTSCVNHPESCHHFTYTSCLLMLKCCRRFCADCGAQTLDEAGRIRGLVRLFWYIFSSQTIYLHRLLKKKTKKRGAKIFRISPALPSLEQYNHSSVGKQPNSQDKSYHTSNLSNVKVWSRHREKWSDREGCHSL